MPNRRDLHMFRTAAAQWWDPTGPMAGLRLIDPIRSEYFRGTLDKAGARCVLELGNGGGILASSVEDGPWKLIAQDVLQEPLVAALPRLKRASLPRCPAARVPFRENSIDALLSSDLLEHVDDARAVLAKSTRVLLRPGRLFLLETVSRTWLPPRPWCEPGSWAKEARW